MKRCSICQEEKENTEFYKHVGHKYGLNTACKPCHTAKNKRVRQARTEEQRKRDNAVRWEKERERRKRIVHHSRKWQINHPEKYMLNRTRNNARVKGIPFDLEA